VTLIGIPNWCYLLAPLQFASSELYRGRPPRPRLGWKDTGQVFPALQRWHKDHFHFRYRNYHFRYRSLWRFLLVTGIPGFKFPALFRRPYTCSIQDPAFPDSSVTAFFHRYLFCVRNGRNVHQTFTRRYVQDRGDSDPTPGVLFWTAHLERSQDWLGSGARCWPLHREGGSREDALCNLPCSRSTVDQRLWRAVRAPSSVENDHRHRGEKLNFF
jgi:hypothetical protein